MTKFEIATRIAKCTGIQMSEVMLIADAFMCEVKDALIKGENVYLRGFGTFRLKKRAEKKARNISKNSTVIIPAHMIPAYKPSKSFALQVKDVGGKR